MKKCLLAVASKALTIHSSSFTKSLLPLTATALMGCVSAVRPLHDYGGYAPTNAPTEEWFTVSYLAEGASSVQESRRKEAYKKMYEHCNGKYELRDSIGSGGGSAFMGTGQNMTAFYSSRRVTFVFRCVDSSES